MTVLETQIGCITYANSALHHGCLEHGVENEPALANGS